MRILSIHLGGHDSSCCLLDNNQIELFVLEERYSRQKHQCHLKNCLDKLLEKITRPVDIITTPTFYRKHDPQVYLDYFFSSYNTKFNNTPKIYKDFYHHRQHASLSFYNSGFNEAAVIVIDGHGSNFFTKNENDFKECETAYYAEYPAKFTTIYKNIICNSKEKKVKYDKILAKRNLPIKISLDEGIGLVYDKASFVIGNSIFDAGKAMGLSAYGNPSQDSLEKLYKKIQGNLDKNNFQNHANYCRKVQEVTEKRALSLVTQVIEKTDAKNICICGGYGMNILANKKYIDKFPDRNFYFEPLSTDTGNAIGSALFFYHKHTKSKEKNPLKSTAFHGTNYPIPNIGVKTSVDDVAKEIFKSKSVGIYYGRAEAGQRALGNRSILFNPLDIKCQEKVNAIKKREWYRPFAAIVLKDDASKLFYDTDRFYDKFMTTCYKAKSLTQDIAPGLLHIDNTCRVQIIDENHHLYDLLISFKQISGYGILLNTSLNLAGEPLIETPQEALQMLQTTELDYVYFLEKKLLCSD